MRDDHWYSVNGHAYAADHNDRMYFTEWRTFKKDYSNHLVNPDMLMKAIPGMELKI